MRAGARGERDQGHGTVRCERLAYTHESQREGGALKNWAARAAPPKRLTVGLDEQDGLRVQAGLL